LRRTIIFFLVLFFCLLIIIPLVAAFTPPSNINGRNFYTIFGFLNITADKFCITGGGCLDDFDNIAGGGDFTNGSSIEVDTIHIMNPPFECNVENTYMTRFLGNLSVCREINQSLINTSLLSNDAGFLSSVPLNPVFDNITFSNDAFIGGNSSCLIFYSPNGLTSLEVCD